MFTSATPVSVAELAQLLIVRKKAGKRTVLFLGSRTGGLFGNQAFYNDLQRYSLRKLNALSEIEKFHECHHVLKKLVDEGDPQEPEIKKMLENFMGAWLQEAAEREVNNLVVELVKEGFFDVIISTNMDSLLEDTFEMLGMRRSQDYRVLNLLDATIDVNVIENKTCTIMKVFGEFVSGNYKAVTGKISWSGSQRLRTVLNVLQGREMLAVGYDSLWDEQVESALLIKGEFWYINETLPEHASPLIDALEHYQGRYIAGIYYERFFEEIYNFIKDSETHARPYFNPVSSDTGENGGEGNDISNGQTSIDKQRQKVFISYSHADESYLERLLVYLKPHVGNKNDLLDIWCDTRFEGGEDWHKEIQEAIATTKVAICLVSPDFIVSKYIQEHELPPLREAASKGEVTILSVILSPCSFSKSGLNQYQLMHKPSLTLEEMSGPARARVWMDMAKRVEKLLFS